MMAERANPDVLTRDPDLAPRLRPRSRADARCRVARVVAVLAVLGFYVWCATSYGKELGGQPDRLDFQNLQADAFLAGQLNLRLAVPPGLAALPDPYDATANAPYRTDGRHDLTYYDGRLYTYFGPAPVLLAYLPYRLLGQGDLSPTLACLLFGAGGFLASVGCFRVVARRFFRPLSWPTEGLCIVAVGMAAPVGWLISIGRSYEVPIACGYFLVSSGLLCLLLGLYSTWRHPRLLLGLGALLLAASVGARPNLIWTLALVAFAFAAAVWGDGRRIALPAGAAVLGLPVVAIGAALAWYNVARFGTATEFGTSYMLLGENVRLARANELGFLRTGLWEYLFSPARRRADSWWPQLRAASSPTPSETSYLREPVAGLVPNLPASVGGIVAFAFQPMARLRSQPWLSWLIGLLAGIGVVILAVTAYHFHGVTMRYQMDFAPLLVLASVLGWCMFVDDLDRGTAIAKVLGAAAVVAVGWSAMFSVAITTYPCLGTGSC